MGRIVSTVIVSLDGITESPGDWGMRFFDADAQRDSLKRLLNSEAMLMGRQTYEALSAVWPTRSGPFADRINSIKKYVVSSRLAGSSWTHSELLTGDVVETIGMLKTSAVADLTIFGFGQLARTLFQANLVDELRMAISPVFVGQGDGLHTLAKRRDMRLVSSETLPTGVVVLTYRPPAVDA